MPAAKIADASRDSYAWLDEVAQRIDGERRDAYHALQAVLTALRDRLPVDVAMNLSARMPLLVRGIFFDNFDPGAQASRAATFVGTVEQRLAAAPRIDPRLAIDAVFGALVRYIDPALFDGIEDVLPPELRASMVMPAAGAEPAASPVRSPAAAEA